MDNPQVESALVDILVVESNPAEARLIASFDTAEADVADFISLAREAIGSKEG